jgi:hypothetical protein
MNTRELVQTINTNDQDYEYQEKIASLTELFRRSHNSWSVCGDTDAYVKREITRYLANVSKAKQLDEQGALDYKTGAVGFIAKYYELLTAHHSRQINCPSWFVTGRGGRNMSKYEQKQKTIHEKEGELYDFLKRLDHDHAENYKQNREHQEHRKEIMPTTYAEKYQIFQELILQVENIEQAVKAKNYQLAVNLMLDYEKDRKVATVWYEKKGSNRYIKRFLESGYRNGWENINFDELRELATKEITVEKWYELIKIFNKDAITYSGNWTKKLKDNIIGQARKLKEWSELYDKKEGE